MDRNTILMAIEDVRGLVQLRERILVSLIISLASILGTKILSRKIGGWTSKEKPLKFFYSGFPFSRE
jgi:hypothetical protein